MEQARYPEAEQALTAAYARAAALATRHPRDADMLFERGQAEFWIGYVARRRGDRATQRQWLVRYRDTTLALAVLEGSTERAQLEVVSGHHNLATLDVEAGEIAGAQTGFLAEQATLEAMIAAQPAKGELRHNRADATSWLGTIAERDGRFAEAIALFEATGKQYEELARLEPDSPAWRFERAQCLTFAGALHALTGAPAAATSGFREATRLVQELVARDPSNKRWLSLKLSLQLRQAAPGQTAAGPALTAADETRRTLEMLLAAEPSSLSFGRLSVMASTLEARLLLAEGRLVEAAEAGSRAVRLAEPLLRSPQADVWTRHLGSQALLVSGRIAAARGQPGPDSLWRQALAALGPDFAAARDWRLLEPAALALRLAGDEAGARPLIARLKSFGYRPADPLTAATLGLAD